MTELCQLNSLLLVLAMTLGTWFAGTPSVKAGIADHFPVIGNEREVVVDPVTGRMLVFVTSSQYLDTQYYPHSYTWAENDHYLLVESIRPRPDGTHPHPDETQLLAADTQTGQLYWLGALEVEDVAQYGTGHVGMGSDYHCDYARGTNSLLYNDETQHNLYLLDLDTGRRRQLWHVPDGQMGPPSIAADGSRVMVPATYPGPLGDFLFDNRTTVIVGFDIDTNTNDLLRGPYVVYSYTERKAPPDNQGRGTYIRMNHIQINPGNTALVSFCHGYTGTPDETVDKTRLWYARVDGSMVKMLTLTPAGRIHTHEIWGSQGQHLYYVDLYGSGAIRRVAVETGIDEELIGDLLPRCLHITVSDDENRIVFDTQTAVTPDADNNRLEWIKLFDRTTGQVTALAHQYAGISHPRHAHPQITGDGEKVAFCVATGPTSRVAYIELN